MADRYADQNVIRRLLHESRVWVFVGLSDDPDRTAYEQAQLMQKHGKRIVPVHPKARDVLGERAYTSLDEVPGEIDVVGIYRRTEYAGEAIDAAIKRGAKAVWLPLGVIDETAAQRARDAGLDVVMNRCPGVEWALRR